jgi:MGT family glycosyltransferase
MSRFLFATMPAVGHTRPALPLSRLLVERGHRVRWYSGAAFADTITDTGAAFHSMSDDDYSLVGLDDFYPERRSQKGLRKLRFDLVHAFARPARTQIRDVQALLAAEPADVVVGDAGFLAGPLLHELGGPPFAALGISVLGFPSPDLAPFGLGLGPARGPLARARNRLLDGLMRRVLFDPMTAEVNRIRGEHDLPATTQTVFEYQLPAKLYLQFSAPGFEYPRNDLPGNVHFVGPPMPQPDPGWTEPPWWPDVRAGRPVVAVTQGTVVTETGQLIEPALAGLADQDVLVIALTGSDQASAPRRVPDNARVETFIPFQHLLPHIDVMVTNGGYGGVQLALAHGVPIVAAGKTEDKIEVNARIAHSGVGLNLRTQNPKPDQIRAAVRRVLDEPGFAARAREMQREIDGLSSHNTAVELLEDLATIHQTNRAATVGDFDVETRAIFESRRAPNDDADRLDPVTACDDRARRR